MMVKGMLEFQRGIDLQIMKANLFNLSELDRALGSPFSCRRQSVLGLLDEPNSLRCSQTDNPCDNCKQPIVPVMRPVSDQVRVVMDILQTSPMDVLMLRELLSGIKSGCCSDVAKWQGLLQTWPSEEIAQFTDFLINDGFVCKQGSIVNDSPVCFLQPSSKSQELLSSSTEIFFPVFESSVINVFNQAVSWRDDRTRLHHLEKRRFGPKQRKSSS